MVQLKNKEDLKDTKGQLGMDFRSASLASLHVRFFSAVEENRSDAAVALDRFYRVASRLCIKENDFNRRARPSSGRPSLMNNLRGPDHLSALREFSAAKEAVLGFNPSIGEQIIRLAERDIETAARAPAPKAKASAPSFGLN